jgi:phospholipase C
MLENRSFDHIFGFSGLPGINGLTGNESNVYDGITYTVQQGAEDPMSTDSNHEFLDTMEQLCGAYYSPKNHNNPFPKGPYPKIDNSGFVANYITIADEDTGLPGIMHYGDTMKCATTDQIPVILQLAQEFAVCDQWYASIPGPTWPNRLFAMGATSSGLDDTPSKDNILEWEIFDGLKMVKGNFFHHLHTHKLKYRLYHDSANQFAHPPKAPFYEGGGFSMVSALEGIYLWDVHSFRDFESDLNDDYPYEYTFIEPNYGNSVDNTYTGGSSQHPEDYLFGGEGMIAATYNAIRNSPLWDSSLLFITYDEHGGFYDHSKTPRPAPPPNDNPDFGYSINNFDFSSYGVRVPAVVISPLIKKGTVDKNLYDHTSMLKTVEDIWGLPNLTDRDLKAVGLTSLLTEATPRIDCPTHLQPTPPATVEEEAAPVLDDEAAFTDTEPLVHKGNVIGHLHVAMKADYEMSDRSEESKAAIRAKVAAIKTKGQARAYFAEVWGKVQTKKSQIS